MRRPASVHIALSVAAVVAVALLATWFTPQSFGLSDEVPLGAVLSEEDRRELDAPAIERGDPPPPPDPAVDFTNPEAVARAYLVAAHSVTAADAGRTSLRAAAYAAPGTPPASVGRIVVDPPEPGSVRTAAIDGINLVAASDDGHRRGYLATVRTMTGPPGASDPVVTTVTAYVALTLQPDGRWLVGAESPDPPAGEDS